MSRGIFKLRTRHTKSIDHTGRASVRRFWSCAPGCAATLSAGDFSQAEAVVELRDC